MHPPCKERAPASYCASSARRSVHPPPFEDRAPCVSAHRASRSVHPPCKERAPARLHLKCSQERAPTTLEASILRSAHQVRAGACTHRARSVHLRATAHQVLAGACTPTLQGSSTLRECSPSASRSVHPPCKERAPASYCINVLAGACTHHPSRTKLISSYCSSTRERAHLIPQGPSTTIRPHPPLQRWASPQKITCPATIVRAWPIRLAPAPGVRIPPLGNRSDPDRGAILLLGVVGHLLLRPRLHQARATPPVAPPNPWPCPKTKKSALLVPTWTSTLAPSRRASRTFPTRLTLPVLLAHPRLWNRSGPRHAEEAPFGPSPHPSSWVLQHFFRLG